MTYKKAKIPLIIRLSTTIPIVLKTFIYNKKNPAFNRLKIELNLKKTIYFF